MSLCKKREGSGGGPAKAFAKWHEVLPNSLKVPLRCAPVGALWPGGLCECGWYVSCFGYDVLFFLSFLRSFLPLRLRTPPSPVLKTEAQRLAAILTLLEVVRMPLDPEFHARPLCPAEKKRWKPHAFNPPTGRPLLTAPSVTQDRASCATFTFEFAASSLACSCHDQPESLNDSLAVHHSQYILSQNDVFQELHRTIFREQVAKNWQSHIYR